MKQVPKTPSDKQSVTTRSQDPVVNTVGIDNPINTEEALTALKEIKVLSQQIVRLHDRNHEVLTSESEL